MTPVGLDSFNLRKENKSRIYAYESQDVTLDESLEDIFKSNNKAWAYFSIQPPSYRKKIIHRIMSAKRQETRLRRLNIIIDQSQNYQRVD